MNPDKRRLRANVIPGVHELIQCPYCAIGKLLIGNSVRIPVLPLKGRPIRHRMEQWPECCIATSIVVRVKHLRINLHGDHLKRPRIRVIIARPKIFTPEITSSSLIDAKRRADIAMGR